MNFQNKRVGPTGGNILELKMHRVITPPEKVKYIRYVRENGGPGDVIRLMALGQGLRKIYKNAKIHYFGPKYLESLIAPRCREAFDLYLASDIRRPRDMGVDEITYPHLYTGIKYDISIDGWCPPYLHEPNTQGVCSQDRTELWCRCGSVPFNRPHMIPLTEDTRWKDYYLKKYKGKKIIGFQPGATCPSRAYPYKHWNTLCNLLIERGIHLILFDVCERWQQDIDTRKLEKSIARPWPETLGKILATDLMITPDSGFFHLSGALKKKTLGLFGPTSGEIIVRPWRLEEKTHHFLELSMEEAYQLELPVTESGNFMGKMSCKPKCYQRWERGWNADRYRTHGKFCDLLENLTPYVVFNKIMELIN